MNIDPTNKTTAINMPKILNVGNKPIFSITLPTVPPNTIPPRPKPSSMTPDAKPALSAKLLLTVLIMALYPIPTPLPHRNP